MQQLKWLHKLQSNKWNENYKNDAKIIIKNKLILSIMELNRCL